MPPYSARNKVPTIQKLATELSERLNLQNADASKAASGKDSEKIKAAKAASRRKVVDPTTKNEVVIQDVDGSFEQSIRRPKITVPLADRLPKGDGESYRQALDDLAPPEADPARTKDYLHHSKNHDVVYHPVPTADLKASFYALEGAVQGTTAAVIVGIVGLNWLVLGGGWKGILASLFAGVIVACGIHLWLRNVQEDANAVNWDAERKRAIAATESLVPESVEWMNSLMGIVWKLINPEMFAAVADTLEDVMQASVPPALIHNVKVSSIGLGDESFKILSLRSLPSAEGDSTAKDKANDKEKSQKEKDEKKEQRELEGEDDPDAKYYNLEASFAYNAIPATGVIGKAKNLHLEVIFYLGIQGLLGVPLPIFVELNGIIGTIRLRFQLTPNPPFLRNLTFTFMGLPKIDASAVPLTSKGINVLNLPLISGFINSSIAAALDIYVAPKSLIMDMSKILQGDSVKKETDAMGLIYIKIKRAEGIAAQDRSGKSDPFITLAFSEFGKPVYCSRIIEQDLNPRWNEQTCLLIYQDQLTSGEKLSVELWDSDMVTSDDVVGKVEFDLRDLIKNYASTISEREDTLKDDKGETLPGKLYWDIGYFPRAQFKESMKTDGKDVSIPKSIRDRPEFQDDKGTVTTQHEIDVTTTPPDPSLPTGICSVLIHEVRNLEVQRPTGSFGSYQPWTPAQITGENTDEEADSLPSSYCTILQNDELVFKTRTKVKSSAPIFNAQTERFVRDWRAAVFTITCRNSTLREHDPILGAITIKLSDVLKTASQNTSIYALDGGMGYGRIMVSVLFRSVDLKLPKNLLGWDLGSVEVLGDKVVVENDSTGALSGSRIALLTDSGKASISRRWIDKKSSNNGIEWNLGYIKEGAHELQRHRILIPVRHRYQSALRLEFFSATGRKPVAYAVYWLSDLIDNTSTILTLPVYKTTHPKQLLENYISDAEHDESVEAEKIGVIKLTVRFKMGMDNSHEQWIKTNDDHETYESWCCSVAEGYRTRIVKRQTPETVKELISDDKVDGANVKMSAGDRADADADDDEHETGDDNAVRVPREAPGFEQEVDSPPEDSHNDTSAAFGHELDRYASASSSIVSDDGSSIVMQEDLTDSEIEDEQLKKRRQKQDEQESKADLRRKHRGTMNIKALRHLKFSKDEAKVLGHKIKGRFSMKGREPGGELLRRVPSDTQGPVHDAGKVEARTEVERSPLKDDPPEYSPATGKDPALSLAQMGVRDDKGVGEMIHHKTLIKRTIASWPALPAYLDYSSPTPTKDDNPLIHALKTHNDNLITFHARDTDLINAHTYLGYTPLHLAAHLGLVSGASILLSNGALTNSRDENNQTPLLIAICHNQPQIVDLLLQNSANIHSVCGMRETTALHAAAASGFPHFVSLLLEKGAMIDTASGRGTALQLACRVNSFDSASLLLEKGANPNARSSVALGVPPIMSAMRYGNTELIDLLLKYGADINLPYIGEKDDCTALFQALTFDFQDLARKLIREGADVNWKGKLGTTCLMRATALGHLEMCGILIDGGASLDAENKTGMNAVLVAALSGKEDIVDFLLKKGASGKPPKVCAGKWKSMETFWKGKLCKDLSKEEKEDDEKVEGRKAWEGNLLKLSHRYKVGEIESDSDFPAITEAFHFLWEQGKGLRMNGIPGGCLICDDSNHQIKDWPQIPPPSAAVADNEDLSTDNNVGHDTDTDTEDNARQRFTIAVVDR
ncbi:Meiotically up-regulated [Hyphodiscus hymeniophilus]|uniref:Meiotically up-regulated n=1 Tax=Hyphodiscus hymeniophilus TaxID=353542 RepID=A0A9P7AVL7_9HELO|nr:Meiotically up-regulated [Hyphodiscus hymeniophilus]